VLINCREQALLCDFGLSRFVIDNSLWRASDTRADGGLRWMAPELLTQDECVPTMASDIYSYGMTCYEILSRQAPFESVRNDLTIMRKVINGIRPERLDLYNPGRIWTIIVQCWAQDPDKRPSTQSALKLIRNAVQQSSPRVDLEEISKHILRRHQRRSSFVLYLAATSVIMRSPLTCLCRAKFALIFLLLCSLIFLIAPLRSLVYDIFSSYLPFTTLSFSVFIFALCFYCGFIL
jgi:serine/threonine protein kinase